MSTPKQYALFPIRNRDAWDMYKTAMASFWSVEEVDLSRDAEDWKKLTEDERYFVLRVLAFFATADGIVNENLAERFLRESQDTSVKCFYGFQIMIENVHAEMYALMLQTYVADTEEREALFNAIETEPAIKKKAEWAQRWIESTEAFDERVVAFACVEGIFFSSSFCAIFWLKKRGLMQGLSFSNELISRDEGLHRDFACLLFKQRRAEGEQLPRVVPEIVRSAVEAEREFVKSALPVALIGINADLMCTYVEFCADHLLNALGYDKHYGVQNPFPWMDLISMDGKTNFFERRVGEYKRAPLKISLTNAVFNDTDF